MRPSTGKMLVPPAPSLVGTVPPLVTYSWQPLKRREGRAWRKEAPPLHPERGTGHLAQEARIVRSTRSVRGCLETSASYTVDIDLFVLEACCFYLYG
ncbi:hypothetical protein NDU88_006635 [Pleurodeles waltl]|uniref:Uncharacterized protein n=1 Tax=Pleurodeles waltl TaxID=8319 RepID=A0AAV7WY49_PLEWA|nr:hypothetical protein NDU88_006635 [Pleurodeles waltl]